MSIRVLQSPEPFAANGERERPILAESDAYRQLSAAMRRYANGEINGRSYLISGHRGSGKTTLVLQVAWELRNFKQTKLTPLLVRLQGPDLLPGPENQDQSTSRTGGPASTVVSGPTDHSSVEGKEPDGDGVQPRRAPDDQAVQRSVGSQRNEAFSALNGKLGGWISRPPVAVAERALQQITQAVYRTFCEELADAFSRRLADRRDPSGNQPEVESSELAVRFRLALDQAPSPADLREFYRLGGVLDKGVLDGPDRRPGQGMRELAALSSASSAFRVVVGQVSSSRKEGRSDRTEQKRTLALDASIQDLVQRVLVLALGGAIGTGALAAGEGGLVAGVLAVGTALVATMILRLVSTRMSAQSSIEEYSFIRDYTSSTLERELPVLIQRLKAAGLAPVFMVDELDKVQWLQRDIRTVVSQLKQFVSGRAFFCFLTDRDYFEHLRDRSLREPYPHEHTFFTDRLLVLFRPSDLHEYLERIIDVEGNELDDEIHKELLTFLLLHRSKMHPVDLQRQLRRFGGDGRKLAVPSLSRPRSWDLKKDEVLPLGRGLRLTIMVQLAVEVLLDREPLRSRLEQDPHFAQPVYDALYYVSRIWEEGRVHGGEFEHAGALDLCSDAFHRYLAARMNPNRPLLLEQSEDTGGVLSEDRIENLQLPLNPRDESLLLEQVKRLVVLLSDPRRLKEELDRQPLSYKNASAARDSIPTEEGDGLILKDESSSDQYSFLFDPYGRRLRTVGTEPSEGVVGLVQTQRGPERADLKDWIETVSSLDRRVYDLTGLTLSNLAAFHVLSAVPTWTQVEEAMARLRHFVRGGETYELMEDDSETLAVYVQQLESRLEVLMFTILYGAAVGRAASHINDLVERRAEGIRVLTTGLGFDRFREVSALMKELERYGRTVNAAFDASSEIKTDSDNPFDRLRTLKALLDRSDSPYSQRDVELHTKDSWSKWKQRLERRVVAGRKEEVEITEMDLWCKVASLGPGSLLRLDLDKMTLAEWTAVLLEGMGRGQKEPGQWLAVAAFVELGLGRLAVEWTENRATDSTFDETASGWLRRMRYSRPRALEGRRWAVFLRSSQDSMTVAWRPSSRYGAISLQAGLGGPEVDSLLAQLFPASTSPIVMTELPEPASAKKIFERIWNLAGGNIYNFGLKRRAHDEDEGFDGHGTIIGATGLDEAMDQALRQTALP